jgi:hypothetical protein
MDKSWSGLRSPIRYIYIYIYIYIFAFSILAVIWNILKYKLFLVYFSNSLFFWINLDLWRHFEYAISTWHLNIDFQFPWESPVLSYDFLHLEENMTSFLSLSKERKMPISLYKCNSLYIGPVFGLLSNNAPTDYHHSFLFITSHSFG